MCPVNKNLGNAFHCFLKDLECASLTALSNRNYPHGAEKSQNSLSFWMGGVLVLRVNVYHFDIKM